ncbi:MAG TPA: ubiquitin-conjugating enzyme E2 [Pirellulaceae bacterium]|nr:ubiquitin-conjugating enzyme E2 [Pirellulaceae bacterium]
MADSPRLRRLRADRKALEQLQAESSIFTFVARGELPETYTLIFNGRGIWRPDNGAPVRTAERHEVYLRLGAAYPRMMPELTWRSPIFHPNISASGVVCLGGYGTYWVPSLSLDELCTMLWDMIRFANYDPNSPYNRDAAAWAKHQLDYRFPVDARPIRDRVAAQPRSTAPQPRTSAAPRTISAPVESEIVYLDAEIVDAEILDDNHNSGETEIVFID